MRLLMLYRPESEHARTVEEYVHDFVRADPSRKMELLSVDTREGARMAELYDVMTYPAILAIENDGHVMKDWTDGQFPLMNELAYYSQA